jgi:hypothetical protein
MEGTCPTLPSMEELGRYRTLLWTLDSAGGLLRAAQSESTYHVIEGYVRAGGNLVLEGQSALTSLSGSDQHTCPAIHGPGCFVHDNVGIDSLRNAGAVDCPSHPEMHGYAFLGGLSAEASGLPDAPVDTLDKWASGYAQHGGLPLCEVVRPLGGVRPLYVFNSYLNPDLDGRVCATLRTPTDGTGSVAYLGFPLYYIETEAASLILPDLLSRLREWQRPAELVDLWWDSGPDSVRLSWMLDAGGDTLACYLERRDGAVDEGGDFVPVGDGPLFPHASGIYSFTDADVAPLAPYTYRLIVEERWGGRTVHGPWEIHTQSPVSSLHLGRPSPNPSSGIVRLEYLAPRPGMRLTASVFNVAGRRVKRLLDDSSAPADGVLEWDGTGSGGRSVASGVYFIRLESPGAATRQKLVRLR